MRQLFTESVMLALLGGSLGVLLSFGAVRLLARLNPGLVLAAQNRTEPKSGS